AIHNAAFAALGLDATYEAVRVPGGGFASITSDLLAGQFVGINVTMPHKDDAYVAVDDRDPLATLSRAVNTIVVSEGRLHGHNTDVAGVVHAVDLLGLADDCPVVVLGYGGAARAAVVAMSERTVYVCGRDEHRAAALAEATDGSIDTLAWGSAIEGAIVINATPLGMHGESLPEAVARHAAGIIDMTYGSKPTPAIDRAAAAGIPHADGIDMLTGQAYRAFELFTGLPAPRDVMALAARSR
ncbi:MAG: shikimate dehydrogenase, partial [Actinomycetia bacterium]|nr:shikimate dehydrogenase [Actinomycetes bacterium]